MSFYVVGKATEKVLSSCPDLPLTPRKNKILGAESGNGEALAHFIISYYTNNNRNPKEETRSRPLLYLTGDKNRETLPQILGNAGFSVAKFQVYETGVVKDLEEKLESVIEKIKLGKGKLAIIQLYKTLSWSWSLTISLLVSLSRCKRRVTSIHLANSIRPIDGRLRSRRSRKNLRTRTRTRTKPQSRRSLTTFTTYTSYSSLDSRLQTSGNWSYHGKAFKEQRISSFRLLSKTRCRILGGGHTRLLANGPIAANLAAEIEVGKVFDIRSIVWLFIKNRNRSQPLYVTDSVATHAPTH
jgi:hypothetical protein